MPSTSPGRWTPQEMLRVRQVGDVQVSPDGGRVLFTVTTAVTEDGARWRYASHVYLAEADNSESALPLTFGDHSAVRPNWSPNGDRICFVSDRHGAGDLYLLSLAGGEAQRLTATENGVGNFKWSPDGRFIAFTTQDASEDVSHQSARVMGVGLMMNHLWVVELDDFSAPAKPSRLTQGDFNVDPVFSEAFNWSPDGNTIAFSHTPAPQQGNRWPVFGDISTVDVASGAVEGVVQTDATSFGPVYSPDGEWLAYALVERPTWPGIGDLYIVPAAGGDPRKLHATFDRKPLPVGWSAGGDCIYYNGTFRTYERVGALPADGSQPIDLGPQDGVVSRAHLNHSRSHIGCVFEDLEQPPEAFVLELESRGTARRLSTANAQLPDYPLGRTELITWKSSGGQEIEGILTYPADYEPGRACPLIVDLHGGPHWFFSQVFVANPQPYQFPLAAFAASGYAVLRCNIRGSGGYGPEFRFAVMEDLGGVDFGDVMAGVDHVIDLGVADAGRLGILGWSYGGYLAAWAITQTDRFKAACMLAPVTNLVSFTGTTDNHELFPGYLRTEFWDDDAELFVARSPVMQASGVATPGLFLHGEADSRVPISQSTEMYDALRRQGCETQMVAYPDMGHVPTEAGQLLGIMERSLAWYDRFL